MNENIDLTKILEGCPRGTKLYSSIFGEVRFVGIDIDDEYSIKLQPRSKFIKPQAGSKFPTSLEVYHAKDGRLSCAYDGECTLFPSKDQRDWSKFKRFWDKSKVDKFDPDTLQPFDKVLARDYFHDEWMCTFFSHIRENSDSPYVGVNLDWRCCIPYNDNTKHLVGTTDEAPEYYRYWED